MRVLQLIDSLETGGAERMAVNYANGLKTRIEFSGLAATRKEGGLKNALSDDVPYIFLGRKSTFDIKALLGLKRFCKRNSVQIIHAHSTSWFFALCVKFLMPSIKLVWHDHYGLSEFVENRSSRALKFGSRWFSGIISVNKILENWAMRKLNCANVIYLPNFAQPESGEHASTELFGQDGKRVLLLANLREQKDHPMLVEAVRSMKNDDWTFHLVGKDWDDEYSKSLKAEIAGLGLSERIFIYGSRNDTQSIISRCDICVLTSKSEGLPVALLEYGFAGKPVVTTSVGEIPNVIQNQDNGILCESGDAKNFAIALDWTIENHHLAEKMGIRLLETVEAGYSENAVLGSYRKWLNAVVYERD